MPDLLFHAVTVAEVGSLLGQRSKLTFSARSKTLDLVFHYFGVRYDF